MNTKYSGISFICGVIVFAMVVYMTIMHENPTCEKHNCNITVNGTECVINMPHYRCYQNPCSIVDVNTTDCYIWSNMNSCPSNTCDLGSETPLIINYTLLFWVGLTDLGFTIYYGIQTYRKWKKNRYYNQYGQI